MATPNFPYLTTSIVLPTDGTLYARIVPSVYGTVPSDVLDQFVNAIKGARQLLPSASQGKSGIKSLTGGGYEVKINSGARLFTSASSFGKENGVPIVIFDRYKAKHS